MDSKNNVQEHKKFCRLLKIVLNNQHGLTKFELHLYYLSMTLWYKRKD